MVKLMILVVEYLMKKHHSKMGEESKQQRKKVIPKRKKSKLLLQPVQKVIKEIKERKKVTVKWTKEHCEQKKELDLDQDKRAREKLLSSNLELAELMPWSAFEMIFGDIIDLLVKQTNLYVKRDRNKMNFSISKKEMINFIGLIFLSGYNIRKSIQDYWSVDPGLGCSSFRETMS